ncbi:hypothetical protein SESBI_49593 [Sesbania bispinosa]|nr:hypothetical protein SESBI_49593 [Sesbania bispinosa]
MELQQWRRRWRHAGKGKDRHGRRSCSRGSRMTAARRYDLVKERTGEEARAARDLPAVKERPKLACFCGRTRRLWLHDSTRASHDGREGKGRARRPEVCATGRTRRREGWWLW